MLLVKCCIISHVLIARQLISCDLEIIRQCTTTSSTADQAKARIAALCFIWLNGPVSPPTSLSCNETEHAKPARNEMTVEMLASSCYLDRVPHVGVSSGSESVVAESVASLPSYGLSIIVCGVINSQVVVDKLSIHSTMKPYRLIDGDNDAQLVSALCFILCSMQVKCYTDFCLLFSLSTRKYACVNIRQ